MPKAAGIIDLVCTHSVPDTVERLEAALTARGIKVFAQIDQAEEARAVGLTLLPTVLVIFGDPKAGTPLMNQHPSLAVDLPLKALIWESPEGGVRLSYNSPDYLQERHGLESRPFAAVEHLLQSVTQ
jgi:uncharacterized protein (DUF302 family)